MTKPQMYDMADSILAQKLAQSRGRGPGVRRRHVAARPCASELNPDAAEP